MMQAGGGTTASVLPEARTPAFVDGAGTWIVAAGREAADDEWLCGVLHDLNNELMVLKWQVELLRRRVDRGDGLDRHWFQEDLVTLDATAKKLIRLTGELRGLSSPRATGTPAVGQRECDLVALTRQVAAGQQQVAPRHVVSVETVEETIVGWWQAARLERVVDNLLGNAVKYSPQGGTVAVRLARERARDAECAVLTVHDSGIGIAAADLVRIFEPCYRGNNVTDHQRGTGMGLAIVCQLVAAYDGTIAVDSQLGRGSTFTVRLPLHPQSDHPGEHADAPLPAFSLTKVTAACSAMS